MLIEHKDVLTRGLRGNSDEEGAAAADLGLEVAPVFKFCDTVRAPAATEEFEDDGAEGDEVSGVNQLVGSGVGKCERGGFRAGCEDAVFDASGEELGDGLFGEGEALGLDQSAGVLGDAVELVLKRGVERGGHESIIAGLDVRLIWLERFRGRKDIR